MVRTIDRYDYEFAPITFLNYNAKGFNEFSDGFEPDVDIATYFKDDANQSHVNNASMFPMPLAPWGMASYDIALMETMMRITGGTFKTETAEPAPAAVTRGLAPSRITPAATRASGHDPYGAGARADPPSVSTITQTGRYDTTQHNRCHSPMLGGDRRYGARRKRRQKNKRRQPNDKRRQPPRNKGRRFYLGKTARRRNMIPRRRATASHTGPTFRP